ncbi:MAG: hypothetical protein EBR82_18270 [Caulobacteraceae bacterium]|nr:hypothetical protein [Caulobacteraceae bacterium]
MGNVLYADSVNGTSGAAAFSPETASSTMIGAMGKATASNDDYVYVAPGHAETVTGAAGMTFSKAGIRWMGRGVGRNRPTITFSTSTAAQIIISGANQTFNNFVFDFTGIDAIVAAISITAADVAFEDCEFITNNATAGCVLGILTAATAARLRIENCRFLGVATNSGTTTTAQIQHEVGVDYLIRNCYFTGKMTQAILNATTILRGMIDSNRFVISTGTVAITMAAGSTPFITNNRINVPSGTAPIVAAAGFMAGNVYSAAAGVTAGTASTF